MHDPIQLDLFQKPTGPMRRRGRHRRNVDDTVPPVGTNNVLCLFPFSRRKSLVESAAARLLACGSRRAKQAAWDLIVLSLGDEVRGYGGDVVRELCAFHGAVDEAIRRERNDGILRGTR